MQTTLYNIQAAPMFCPTIVWQKKFDLALSPVLGFQGSSASIPSDTARTWTALTSSKVMEIFWFRCLKKHPPQKKTKGTWDGSNKKPWNPHGCIRMPKTHRPVFGIFQTFWTYESWHLAKLRIKLYHPCVLDAFQCARSCKDRPANRLDAVAALRTISSPAPGDKLYPGLDDTTLSGRDLCRVRTCTSNNKNISKANVAVSRQFSNPWITRIQHDSTHNNWYRPWWRVWFVW